MASCTLRLPVDWPADPAAAASVEAPQSGAAVADGSAASRASGESRALAAKAAEAGEPAAKSAAEKTAAAKATTGQGPAAQAPLEVTVRNAVLMALENNQELVVQRLQPDIVRTKEMEQQAIFDPLVVGEFGWLRELGRDMNSQDEIYDFRKASPVGTLGVEILFPTGTKVGAGASTEVGDAGRFGHQLVGTRLGLTVTQALLRGLGAEVNLADIRQARLDTLASEYELRGFAEAVVAQVELACWDCLLAERQIEIYKNSISLAQEQLGLIKQRVEAGAIPATDLAAAESEVALRREDIVDVEGDKEKARVLLLRLINPPGGNPWNREVRLLEKVVLPAGELEDVESHVQVALKMRPELNQARFGIQRGDLQIVKTRNGLLPKMDLFVTLGKSGFAETFGGSWGDIDGTRHDFMVGISAEYPIGNHAARAQHERAVLNRRHAAEAVKNLEQLVQADVRTAYIEAGRAKRKAAAAETTRKLDEEKLRVEMQWALLGRSSAFQVARAQRDLVKCQITEVVATVDYLKALVELYRLEGSLLERRGISAPGAQPPEQGGTRPKPVGQADKP